MNQPTRSDSPDSAPSSGAQTPASNSQRASVASVSSSYGGLVSSMWGIIRRFSTEETVHSEQLDLSASQNLKDGINGVFSPTRRTASPFRPPPLDPLILHGYKEGTPEASRLLNLGVAEEIRTMVPERLRIIDDWHLAYSLEQDGASLATLYQKCREYQGGRAGFVLVVKDEEGSTFGAYLSEYPHPAPSYFGNGECFLWRASMLASLPPPPSADTTDLGRNTTLAPMKSPTGASSPTPSDVIRFKAFPYSGLNDYCINCEQGFLSVGSGGGHYGLWLDNSLDMGHSSRCDTFGNEPLSDEGDKFGILGVELWVMGV
ncbi:unnamed protein product [Clonostachys solani]|uniref:Oxidation resistance protein 1 n=1 Tax=Clonostachys solani TaxID=160281 RepID=A0A9N9YPB7_9HYPO|nr:unnamed protein product [Clonostachys solani]